MNLWKCKKPHKGLECGDRRFEPWGWMGAEAGTGAVPFQVTVGCSLPACLPPGLSGRLQAGRITHTPADKHTITPWTAHLSPLAGITTVKTPTRRLLFGYMSEVGGTNSQLLCTLITMLRYFCFTWVRVLFVFLSPRQQNSPESQRKTLLFWPCILQLLENARLDDLILEYHK